MRGISILVTLLLFFGVASAGLLLTGCQPQPQDQPTPDTPPPPPAIGEDGEDVMPMMTIVEAAQEEGFTTLARLAEAAGLTDALSGEGPFTVFAPTNDAFEALPEGTVETLTQPANVDDLTNILQYHVVSGEYRAEDVMGMTTAEALNGQELTFTIEGDAVMVNGAQVVHADLICSNGVIHAIDKVLTPE